MSPLARGAGRPLRLLASLFLLLLSVGLARAAELDLPKLDGRVTDAAGVLSPAARARIEAKLKAHEDKTSDQVVVATIPSLQGTTIEDFANRLFRAWGLGQKAKNNGALLIVAPTERKVRIEVGYGLEGALTDALGKVIITTAITPKFRQGDFEGGIEAGVDAMLSILAGDAEEWHRKAEIREDTIDPVQVVFWIAILIILIVVVARMNSAGGQRSRGGGFIIVPGPSGGWNGGFSDSGSSGSYSDGGGFSGGGGSSGGGGASGDW